MNDIKIDNLSRAELKKLLSDRWPEALCNRSDQPELIFRTSIPALDALFPSGGIPYGQLVEITGDSSSGKTHLLFTILAALTENGAVAYVDFGNSFFPAGAAACGVDVSRLAVVKPGDLPGGMRAAELLLQRRMVGSVVCDLVGRTGPLAPALLHRLRTRTVRAKALVIFLTENNSHIIPSSMVSLRLEVRKKDRSHVEVIVAKSRISPEGAVVELALHE